MGATENKKSGTAKKATTGKKGVSTPEVPIVPMKTKQDLLVEKNKEKIIALGLDITEDNEGFKEDKKLFAKLLEENGNNYEMTIFAYCFHKNIFYNFDLIRVLFSIYRPELITNIPYIYSKLLEINPKFKEKKFFDQIKRENFEKLYSEELSLLSLSEDDKKNRQQVVDILGYDPFKDDLIEERPQLYRDLTGMLSDNMRKDIAKQKAALNVVRSYANIEKYQQKVNELMINNSDGSESENINDYLKLISTIQATINQTAEKNNFTVKGIGSNGRGMLSDVMNQIEEKGIDIGITNFYDIETSKSIQEISQISWKSMLNQINLSKTDYAEIITQQAELVQKAQKTAKNALEALRLVKEKITKQALIEELQKDYRRKGLSEEDIEEFVNREIHMFDLQD